MYVEKRDIEDRKRIIYIRQKCFLFSLFARLVRKERRGISFSPPPSPSITAAWIFIDNLIRTRQMKSLFPSERKTINLRPLRINNSSWTALRLSRLIAFQVRLPPLFRILPHRLPTALSPEEIMHEAWRKFQDVRNRFFRSVSRKKPFDTFKMLRNKHDYCISFIFIF